MNDTPSRKPQLPTLGSFPFRTHDTIRYGDTDRQGHINNAVYATFFETGRVALFYDPARGLIPPGADFVIARLTIEFKAEMRWPGRAEIGTRIETIGRSSIGLAQAVFQGETCIATSDSVVVLMDNATRRSRPLSDEIVRFAQESRR